MLRTVKFVVGMLMALIATFVIVFVVNFKTKISFGNTYPGYVGSRAFLSSENDTSESLEKRNDIPKPGRRYTSSNQTSDKLAIIVPYRDREENLKIFLSHMHPFLQNQSLTYVLYVVEMTPNARFNRALLFNIGFVEALKEADFECFIFHDVDQIPQDNRINYTCEYSPQHLSVAMESFNYKLPYQNFFGGVCAFSKKHFQQINGCSNLFFGWGGEDDDLFERVINNGMKVNRLSADIYRYKKLPHKPAEKNPDRMKLVWTGKKRFKTDGLNSLMYTVSKLEHMPLYTWILVSVNESKILENEHTHTELLPKRK